MTKPSPSLTDRAADYIRRHGLAGEGDHVLAAVSGGPDSVALLDILTLLKDDLKLGRISVAHFDHRLRGEESDADARFVQSLAERFGLAFSLGSADVRAFAASNGMSIEMAARACRHSFFRQTAGELDASVIALGHTADDQAEEVFLRLLRGAGPAGLKAMRPRTPEGIIRPLLFAARDDITRHLLDRGIGFREDASNFEPFCQRNALRLRVFPILRETFHPGVAGTVARFAELAGDEESWWEERVRDAWKSCGGELYGDDLQRSASLDLMALCRLHPAMLRRLLRFAIQGVRGDLFGIHAVHLEPLFEMVFRDVPDRSIRLPANIEAVQRSGKLLIRTLDAGGPKGPPPDEAVEVAGPGTYRFGDLVIEIEMGESNSGGGPASGAYYARMDAARLVWPLTIRSRQPGDRFRPLGMKGSRKLQDFFTDLKIPRDERSKIAILCDSEKIVWVVSLRIDDRVKPGSGTTAVVSARLTGSDSLKS